MKHDITPDRDSWTPVPDEPETRWVDWDDGHAGGYPHPCTEYIGRHRLTMIWMVRRVDVGNFKINLKGGAFHGETI